MFFGKFAPDRVQAGSACNESIGAHAASTRASAAALGASALQPGHRLPDFPLPLGSRESSPARRGGQERSGMVERGGEDEAAWRGGWSEASLPRSVQGRGQQEQCHGGGMSAPRVLLRTGNGMSKVAASPGPGGFMLSQPNEASCPCPGVFWGGRQWLAKVGFPRRNVDAPVGHTAPSPSHSRNCMSFRPERWPRPTWGPCGTMTLMRRGGRHGAGQSCGRGWQHR